MSTSVLDKDRQEEATRPSTADPEILTKGDIEDVDFSPLEDPLEENMRLKAEIAQLKEQMVDKMRGHNKFVGGGQFRVGKASTTGQSACSNCTSSQRIISKLKIDLRDSKKRVGQLESDNTQLTYRLATLDREITILKEAKEENDAKQKDFERIIEEKDTQIKQEINKFNLLSAEMIMKDNLLIQIRSSSGESVETLKGQLR